VARDTGYLLVLVLLLARVEGPETSQYAVSVPVYKRVVILEVRLVGGEMQDTVRQHSLLECPGSFAEWLRTKFKPVTGDAGIAAGNEERECRQRLR
jgi:hypothetical protein